MHTSSRHGLSLVAVSLLTLGLNHTAIAGEDLFGYVKGAEAMPKDAIELYQKITLRNDKGQGTYRGINYETEFEYGLTNKLAVSASAKFMSLDTSGLIIDGYLPAEKKIGFQSSGAEVGLSYMFLSPAKDDIGLSMTASLDYDWIDVHSGQDKDTLSLDLGLQTQKYMLEGELIWVGNLGMESTYADRAPIANLPEDFEWSTDPEMELELKMGTGLSYRFAPNWFVSAEVLFETEFETEIGQERWSFFAGPSLHYGSADWWATLTWLPQLSGGGEQYQGQRDTSLHLIEKTEQEIRLKVAFNF
ncbi:DUF6662 family protein [Shewanella baltica]|uniref:Uncharacterized protein n=1 Tax=Shewanella baltica (strain OS155 / ATCC BAA-1091) TaxID=325240 RepID=A3D116_SHEB5|nr:MULTISPECIES: DUF6662 family protein [Shewanella]ABN60429.1 conserved hypothetical protein [Shewanella baltica OS155]AEG12597.1 hypothetical protein Sbal175_3363 [Shewanella baltica BA175]AEH12780.1 hypothetical protein Sbal117_1002 [Shewanella baltica OS117]EHC07790.1 hypothetical protein Sbal625DRAFT_0122 [Shewanella baltica OS625]EHQ13861.1 hypothetical protein Sbal183_0934 [Shewanella baltica OS183]